MDPLYECKDSQPGMRFLIIITGIAMLAMAIFIPDDPEPGKYMFLLRLVIAFFGILTFVVTPVIRIRVYDDHINIRYGITNLISFNLSNEKITSVRAVTYSPLTEFGGWGIKGGTGKWKGYTAFTASISNKALVIETTEKNYLLGCNNPEEAETEIQNIIGRR